MGRWLVKRTGDGESPVAMPTKGVLEHVDDAKADSLHNGCQVGWNRGSTSRPCTVISVRGGRFFDVR
ncbi:hypothetical protein ACI7RC_05300 [Brevibacillus sp. B_LB10_24]